MGFLGPEKQVATELGAKLDARGNLLTPAGRYATSIPRLFAAGGTYKFFFSSWGRTTVSNS